MNTRILSILFFSFLLGGCASAALNTNAELADCPNQTIWFCRGDGEAPVVRIKIRDEKIRVSPSCVDVVQKSTLVFSIVPPNKHAAGDVKIVPMNDNSNWLDKDNSDNPNLIVIEVPTGLDSKIKYGYGVKVGDLCVDPRVHIEN